MEAVVEERLMKPRVNGRKTLREQQRDVEDLRYAIEESSIVAVADAHGAIRYINHNWRKISQFTSEDLQGRTGHIVQEEFYTKDFVSNIWTSLAVGNIWQGELKFRAKDGSIYWADTSIVPFVKDDVTYKYVVIQKDITARKLVEEQLRLTHEKLQLHVENTPLGFIEWDTQLNVRTLSKRAEEIFGWRTEDLANNGTTAYAKIFEEVLPWISKLAEQLLSGNASGHRMLHRNMTKDGRTVTCEWFNSVVKDRDGKILTIVSLVLDLTDKMETEAQLSKSEAFNRGVLNALSSHVAVVNAQGDIIATNTSWDRFAQQSCDASMRPTGVGSNYFTVCEMAAKQGDELTARALQGMKDILNGKQKEMYVEYPCNSPTGKRWFGMRAMKFEMDEPMLVVAHHDISELKSVENNLLKTRQLLVEAQHMAKMGNWSFSPTADQIYWSEGMFEIFGLPPGTVLTIESSIALIHPDDRQSTMQQLLENRTSGQRLTFPFRILRADNGEERTLQCISDTEMNAKGEAVRLYGLTEDVTEKLAAEKQLLVQHGEREERAAELAVANIELAFQNGEKEARAAELAIANEELLYQNNEKEARAAELAIANEELLYQNNEKEKRATALIATNRELEQAQFERDNMLTILEQRVAERTSELASKNKDVMDSISYAHRIQASLLSPFSQLVTLFEQSFILEQPRDIVSGDFYWCYEKGDRKFIVVADCTGHGVPGALMSIIGNELLNEVIINDNIQNPSEILMQLDIRLKEKMKGDLGEVKDGMDLALCMVDMTFKELYFAGALRPMFMRDAKGGIREIAGSRHCIGGAVLEAEKHFASHKMSFEKGQRIYLSSDGYYSQFGGPRDRKFMKSRFKTSLASVQHLTMHDQCLKLTEILAEWRGDHEQVDDVLVVGIEL